MTPIDESRSPCLAPNKAMSPATTTEPTRAPTTGLFAISSPAAAPVKASSAMPCTAKAIPLVTTNGPMRPLLTATSAAASSACWAKGC